MCVFKKLGCIVLAFTILLTVPVLSLGEGEPFSVETLIAYAANEESMAFSSVIFASYGDFWSYMVDDKDARRSVTNDAFTGEIQFDIGIISAETVVIPCIWMKGSSDKKWSFRKLLALVDDKVFTIDLTSAQDVFALEGDSSNGYAFEAILPMGLDGLTFLEALRKTNGAATLRAYYKKDSFFELVYEGYQEDNNRYEWFFRGLREARFFDENNEVSKAHIRAMEVISNAKGVPKTSITNPTGKIWPTPLPTPLSNLSVDVISGYETIKVGKSSEVVQLISQKLFELGYIKKAINGTKYQNSMADAVQAFQKANGLPSSKDLTPETQALILSDHAIAKPTATPKPTSTPKPTATPFIEPTVPLEMTMSGNWGKKNGNPWIIIGAKNTSKKNTVQSVTMIYYCEDKAGNKLLSNNADEVYLTVTVEKKIKPGKKTDLPKMTLDAHEDTRTVMMAIQSVTFTDGTVATVLERDLIYLRFGF